MMFAPYHHPEYVFEAYDPACAETVRSFSAFMRTRLPDVGVEHIGSTAVPGLGGKNSVNILLIAPSAEGIPTVLEALDAIGCSHHPEKNEPADRPLRVVTIISDGRTFPTHIHTVIRGSLNHRLPLFFREYLISYPSEARKYENLKKNLLSSGASSAQYHAGKQAFIRDVLATYSAQEDIL